MFKIRVADALASFVESALPTFQQGVGLYAHLDLRLENPKDRRRSASTDVALVLYRPSNYTQLYAAIARDWQAPAVEVFSLRSHHDSCWRDELGSIISGTYFEMANKVKFEKQAPADLSESAWFYHLYPVEVEVGRAYNEEYCSEMPKLLAYKKLRDTFIQPDPR